jgi:hypothetical protein
MPFAAVLDASVLYPLPLRDTLLRIAEPELYDVYWSEHILHEVVRNLIADGRATEEQARRLTDTMTAAFEGAAVPQGAVDRIEPGMTNEPKDRHVLAAAVAAGANAAGVTLNLKDFPAGACRPLGIDALHPDAVAPRTPRSPRRHRAAVRGDASRSAVVAPTAARSRPLI